MNVDYTIIGGGIVGLTIAWGMLKKRKTVTIIDRDDYSFSASHGNFGLVWVQSKGIEQPRYAEWSQKSASIWLDFATELTENTGFQIALEQNGGYDLHFSEKKLEETVKKYEIIKQKLNGNYPYEVLGHNALKKEEPHIGKKIIGAILHHQDGHVNPLNLLKALATDVRNMNANILSNKTVCKVDKPNNFKIHCHDGSIVESDRLVLCAGLGSAELGPKLGFKAPITPQRGQLLITEKLPKMIYRPSLIARQVDEGGIQIGDTHENIGFDDNVTQNAVSVIASRAISAYPFLEKVQLVRSWGALRILSPDGLPIYQESRDMSGAFLISCHSGITLAAAHAMLLPEWLEQTNLAPNLEVFNEDRFSL